MNHGQEGAKMLVNAVPAYDRGTDRCSTMQKVVVLLRCSYTQMLDRHDSDKIK